jgi:hypothetical protein
MKWAGWHAVAQSSNLLRGAALPRHPWSISPRAGLTLCFRDGAMAHGCRKGRARCLASCGQRECKSNRVWVWPDPARISVLGLHSLEFYCYNIPGTLEVDPLVWVGPGRLPRSPTLESALYSQLVFITDLCFKLAVKINLVFTANLGHKTCTIIHHCWFYQNRLCEMVFVVASSSTFVTYKSLSHAEAHTCVYSLTPYKHKFAYLLRVGLHRGSWAVDC